MPRKRFEETPYDPFKAEARRVTDEVDEAGGKEPAPTPVVATTPQRQDEQRQRPKRRPVTSPNSGGGGEEARRATPPERVVEIPRPQPLARAQPPGSQSRGSAAMGQAKRFKVTGDENSSMEAFVHRLREASGSGVDFSTISRALWTVAQHAEPQLLEALGRLAMPRRPSNNNALQMAEYEAEWVQVFMGAFRKMPPLK